LATAEVRVPENVAAVKFTDFTSTMVRVGSGISGSETISPTLRTTCPYDEALATVRAATSAGLDDKFMLSLLAKIQ
jgi:hypothetical protein